MTNGQVRTMVGVTMDFNTYSLQHKTTPIVLSMPEKANDQDNLYIRISNDYTQATLDYISKVYSQFDPENKAEFRFLDQNFSPQYQTEEKRGNLLVIFTVLAIAIASLGLLGMVAFSAQQRTKEIGVRKVLGPTVSSIILLLSKDFLKLVLLAIVLATPITVWTMHNWLQDFAYRIGIQWWVFALAGILAVLIAILTVMVIAVQLL